MVQDHTKAINQLAIAIPAPDTQIKIPIVCNTVVLQSSGVNGRLVYKGIKHAMDCKSQLLV